MNSFLRCLLGWINTYKILLLVSKGAVIRLESRGLGFLPFLKYLNGMKVKVFGLDVHMRSKEITHHENYN